MISRTIGRFRLNLYHLRSLKNKKSCFACPFICLRFVSGTLGRATLDYNDLFPKPPRLPPSSYFVLQPSFPLVPIQCLSISVASFAYPAG